MAAKIDLLNPDELTLTDMEIIEGEPYGRPVRIKCVNSGDTKMRDVYALVRGEGAEHIQLARDERDEPGIWAAPGESVIVSKDIIYAGEEFSFWARGVFEFEDREGHYPFEFVIQSRSIG